MHNSSLHIILLLAQKVDFLLIFGAMYYYCIAVILKLFSSNVFSAAIVAKDRWTDRWMDRCYQVSLVFWKLGVQ